MSHDEMSAQTRANNFWHNINWLLVASSFTVAYLIFIVLWIGPRKIIAFSETDQLNAIGDFLAGIFSPLAFIWLVAAVLTQRQELTDTRDQFAENQKVVDAQLETIKDQSVLLQQQHILAEETARKTYRLSLFEQRFRIYEAFIAFGEKQSQRGFIDPAHLEMVELRQKAQFVFAPDVIEWFEEIELRLIQAAQIYSSYVRHEVNSVGVTIEQWINADFKQEYDVLQQELAEQFFNPIIRNEKFGASMVVSD